VRNFVWLLLALVLSILRPVPLAAGPPCSMEATNFLSASERLNDQQNLAKNLKMCMEEKGLLIPALTSVKREITANNLWGNYSQNPKVNGGGRLYNCVSKNNCAGLVLDKGGSAYREIQEILRKNGLSIPAGDNLIFAPKKEFSKVFKFMKHDSSADVPIIWQPNIDLKSIRLPNDIIEKFNVKNMGAG